MSSEKLEFTGHDGHKLAARLDLPKGDVKAVALLAHCFTCSKDIPAARRIAGTLATFGIATLRFDFTGLGHSEGEFANTNFSSNVEDLVLAAGHLKAMNMAPQLLIGHSLGGAAVIQAAPLISSVKAVVTIGAPSSPEHVTHNFNDKLDTIREKGQAEVELAGRTFCIKSQFLDDLEDASLEQALAKFGKRALLVLHAPMDNIVPIDNAAKLFMAAKHPKSFVTLDDSDHLVSRSEDAEYLAEVILAWSKKYLEIKAESPPSDAPEGIIRVRESDEKNFMQDISVEGKFYLTADEPSSYGGTDMGPSPYQFISTGLGACTAMTIRLYANRKKMALDHVYVDVSHNKCHSSESAESESPNNKIDVFRRIVYLEGDLSDEQRQQLLAIADKCPVHKTLHSSSAIETALGAN